MAKLILIPQEITNMTSQIRSYVDISVSSYTNAKQAILEYVDNNALEAETWDASKDTMHICYQAITDEMLLAQEQINTDLDVLESSVGEDDLYEELLENLIEKLQKEIQSYKSSISSWSNRLGMFFGFFDARINNTINNYKNLISQNEDVIEKLQEKIDFLYEVENSTMFLFKSACSFVKRARAAIDDGGIVISGGVVSTEPGWLNSILDDVRKSIEPLLKVVLEEELGMSISMFKELYGEEALENIEDYVKREVDKNGEINNENIILKILETTLGYEVEIVDGEYQFNDGEWYFYTRYTKEEVIKIARGEQTFDETPEIVTKQMLIDCGWDESILTDEMLKECNQALNKYEINTTERLSHFFAQCSYETGYGSAVIEDYDESRSYDLKYSGAGYIQLTHEYGYKAFATYLILEEYPELKRGGEYEYKSPAHNDKEIINNLYESILQIAEEEGLTENIEIYTKIVSEGREYVGQNFAWESAGYDWAIAKELNQKVDDGATVNEISGVINPKGYKSFGRRETYYNNIVNNNAFDNLGMGENANE